MKFISYLLLNMFLLIPLCEVAAKRAKSADQPSVIHIAPNGSDSNSGTIDKPLKSLAKAIKRNAELIYLREGVYRFDEIIANSSNDLTIAAYPNERVVVSGLEPITTEWKHYKEGIYVTTPNVEAWQIFVDGEMLNAARTPNVDGFIEDEQPINMLSKKGSLWDRERTWYTGDKSSTEGLMVAGEGSDFTNINYSLEGAIAILNVGSWKSSYADITQHAGGSNNFEYNAYMLNDFLTWRKPNNSAFYLEGKLEMLDKAGEWFYDTQTKRLYVYSKDGKNPANRVLGKTQSYAMKFLNSKNITLSGIEFRGTTIYAEKSSLLKIEDCQFIYPSYSRRMLRQEPTLIDVTLFNNCLNVEFTNNIVKYSEGEAVVFRSCKSPLSPQESAMMKGAKHKYEYNQTAKDRALVNHYTRHKVRNNLMLNIDISCANTHSIGATVVLFGRGCEFVGNTVGCTGASEMLICDAEAVVAYNDIYSIGHLQYDGAAIQMMAPGSVNTVVKYNWIHDMNKCAIRVDNSEGFEGADWGVGDKMTTTTIVNNTAWDCNGMQIKGDYHLVANNTLFGFIPPVFGDQDWPTNLVIARLPSMGLQDANNHTFSFNNLTQLSSTWFADKTRYLKNAHPLPDYVMNNYIAYYSDKKIVEEMLEDYENRDFRPINDPQIIDKGIEPQMLAGMDVLVYQKGSSDDPLDIGAYSLNDEEYYVAGHHEAKASSPIPSDGSKSKGATVMLAWKPAWRSQSSTLYFGDDFNRVAQANKESDECMGEITKSCFYPKGIDSTPKRYYWRVDSIVDGEIIKGEVWSFTR